MRWIAFPMSLALCLVLTDGRATAETLLYGRLTIPDQSGQVMTVQGAVAPDRLGETLMHEHLFIEFYPPLDRPDRWQQTELRRPTTKEELAVWREPFTVHNRGRLMAHFITGNRESGVLDNLEETVAEVLAYQALGGDTIVDVTPDGLGRQPLRLREVARATGVNIVMGTGFYRSAWHPDDMAQRSLEELTGYMVREIVSGVGDTRIQAGIIGEIPASNLAFEPDSNEVRVLRAAARASRLTGASITVHNEIARVKNNPHVALDILRAEGADLSRVIMGHMTGVAVRDLGFLESLLRRGVYLQFDLLGFPFTEGGGKVSNNPDVEAIVALIQRGYAGQLLVSHDVFTRFQYTKYGGHGFTFAHGHLVPHLRKEGVYAYQIRKMLVENPARVLTFVCPRPLE